ncbi:hypothetical protein LCGC14_2255000 [marine sediment metagenome]|uniref:Uncharacterized protein n=1 Tax=marine sediment metagenome TaxID=412755 RepID=A0A0F9D178_9ZZZZ
MSKTDRNTADREAGRRGGINNAVLTRKLTDDQVREIRGRRANGESCGSIAGDYPVSAGTIYSIDVGRTYRSVK